MRLCASEAHREGMNGHLSIELAHQHQQDLLDDADRSRLAYRPRAPRRPTFATRWRRSRDVPRYDSGDVAGPQVATVGCVHG
jgi:hypothetical protein